MDRNQDLDIGRLWKDPIAGLKAITDAGHARNETQEMLQVPLVLDDTQGQIASSPGNRCGCGVLPNSCPGEPVRPC